MNEAAVGSGVGTAAAVVLALGSVIVLAALHLLAPKIRGLPGIPEEATTSFAGGIAVSYVFLHLLPELSEGNEELREVLGEEGEPSPLLGLEVFVVALLGFLVFYGLERLAERSQAADDVSGEAGGSRARTGHVPRPGTGSRGVFRLHLASFIVYNGIIAYSLPLNYRVSPWFAVLFTIAMALHFVLTDRGLQEHYNGQFTRSGPRLLLVAALFAGWVLAAVFAPTGTLVVTLLVAFLAGSILLNVFKEEIPPTRRSHYGWFVVGLACYALILGLVTAFEQGGAAPEARSAAAIAASPEPQHLLAVTP